MTTPLKITVTITDLRKKLNHYIDLISQGAEVTITRYGKPVAVLISPEKYAGLTQRVGE